ncbi:hypothetical protein [Clavibacter michiganensis]|uniref:hypothetical protein n=1 Tax=Clavibacter michiganensis TaxID=28447 RepID=UPI003EBDE9F9
MTKNEYPTEVPDYTHLTQREQLEKLIRPDLPEGIVWSEFVRLVGQNDARALLREMARRTAAEGYIRSFSPEENGPNWFPPFAYGDLARVVLGNPPKVGQSVPVLFMNTLLTTARRIYVPNTEDLGDWGDAISVMRAKYLQGPDQEPLFVRLARPIALFQQTAYPADLTPVVMTPDWFKRAMGVTVEEYAYIIANLAAMFEW